VDVDKLKKWFMSEDQDIAKLDEIVVHRG